nr:antitoxin VbhA family protein [uncultured Rhodopila sp.]
MIRHAAPDPSEPYNCITAEESARCQAADDYARASLRLEGFTPGKVSDELTRRYIRGEITRAELTATIRAHHGL